MTLSFGGAQVALQIGKAQLRWESSLILSMEKFIASQWGLGEKYKTCSTGGCYG